MTSIVMLPVFAAGLTLGCLFLPLARRGGYRKGWQDSADEVRPTPEPTREAEEFGYRGRHCIGDDAVKGSTAQRATIRALRSPTAEFQAIVATSYRSGELPLIGRPGRPYLVAHMAAAVSR